MKDGIKAVTYYEGSAVSASYIQNLQSIILRNLEVY
jgi:hypothetical protein